MFALILESLSSTELVFILVIALIFFGPRKLPQLARSMGKGLSEFRRASDEFKRTWEREVAMEASKLNPENILREDEPSQPYTEEEEKVTPELELEPANPELVVARENTAQATLEDTALEKEPIPVASEPAPPEQMRKQDWF